MPTLETAFVQWPRMRADGTKTRGGDAAAVLASMRHNSLELAAAAAGSSQELLSQSPAQDGAAGIVAVGAPRLACQAPPMTLTQRWQVTWKLKRV